MTTDASEKAIGAVLTQGGKPVLFVSRTLSGAETRYSNIERKALAVVWACQRLRHLLLGRKFTLVTDHQPLLRIYGGLDLPKVASSRITRWAILLQPFDFKIQYKPGSSIPYADAMTRLKFESDEKHNADMVINDVANDSISPEILQEVKDSIKSDGLANRIKHRIENNQWNNMLQDERAFKLVRESLRFEDGVLWLNDRCYIPPPLRRDAFKVAHQLHTGIQSTLHRLKLSCWWPTIRRDVIYFIRGCSTCADVRPKFTKHPSTWEKQGCFERVHSDWCYVADVGNVLLFVDSQSGWIEAAGPMARTTDNVVKALVSLCARFGVPRKLVTDNAKEFISVEPNNWCRMNGIKKVETPPYHPSSNGTAERGVQTIKQCLRVWKFDKTKMEFTQYLQRVLLLICFLNKIQRSIHFY